MGVHKNWCYAEVFINGLTGGCFGKAGPKTFSLTSIQIPAHGFSFSKLLHRCHLLRTSHTSGTAYSGLSALDIHAFGWNWAYQDIP